MRILVGIPMLTGAWHCKKAIDSVLVNDEIDLLLIDNGAEVAVKEVIEQYKGLNRVNVIVNEKNIFVNPAWNQILGFFLVHRHIYDRVIIMNSDLVLNPQWYNVCKNRWLANKDEILIPKLETTTLGVNEEVGFAQEVSEGTAGVFIDLNIKHAVHIYPIPDCVLLWFGDQYIFEILRGIGYKTVIPHNLYATHYWSSTIDILPNKTQMIEEDKVAFEVFVKPIIKKEIEKFKKA